MYQVLDCVAELSIFDTYPFHIDWLRQVRATLVTETVFQNVKKRTVHPES